VRDLPHHLVIEDSRVRLTLGPRENGHRPAIDVLFPSAAAALVRSTIAAMVNGEDPPRLAGAASEQAEIVRHVLAGAAGRTLRRVLDTDEEEVVGRAEEGAA
jgi:hypothetical protein